MNVFPTLHLGNDALREKLCILIVMVCSTSSEQIVMENVRVNATFYIPMFSITPM